MKSSPTTLINEIELSRSSEILRALTHPLRMRILEFIDQNDLINVNKIYSSLDLEQSITSQHLRILRQADLVKTERRGKFIHYSVNRERLARTIKAIHVFKAAVAVKSEQRSQAR